MCRLEGGIMKTIYKANVYVGGLADVKEKTIYEGENKASAYAALDAYLKENPLCCKAYVDEIWR